jgi:hypothetical protein
MTIWDVFFPVERGICMAAFIGTIVWLINGKKRGKTAILTAVIANYMTAVYLTALFAELSNLKSLAGIAFAIGVGGFSLVERLINQIFSKISGNLKPEDDGSTS